MDGARPRSARVLRTRAADVRLCWEAVLPPEVLRLPEELARVALLDATTAAGHGRPGKAARTSRLRSDTTVVPADAACPTTPECLPRRFAAAMASVSSMRGALAIP